YPSSDSPPRGVAVCGVSPNYFSTPGISIVNGRPLQDGDFPCGAGGRCSVCVFQTFLRGVWREDSALGKSFPGGSRRPFEIVGVARDISMTRLGRADDPMMYEPLKSITRGLPYQPLVRFMGDEATVGRAMTAIIRDLAPELVVGEARTVQAIRQRSLQNLW